MPSRTERRPRRTVIALALAATLPLAAVSTAAAAAAGPGANARPDATASAGHATRWPVRVRGEVARPGTFTLERLRKLPQHRLKVRYGTSGGTETHEFSGPLLLDVLNAAGPSFDPGIRNDALRHFVAVTGSDGYRAIVSWGELDPSFAGTKVLLALRQDGKPLDKDGPRLVVPGDAKGGRYVGGVTDLHLGSADDVVGRG